MKLQKIRLLPKAVANLKVEVFFATLIFLVLFLSGLQDPEYDALEVYHHIGTFQMIASRIAPVDTKRPTVYLASAICASRVQEGLTMLKSALLFSKDIHLYVIVFTDKPNESILQQKLTELVTLGELMNVTVSFELHPLWLTMENPISWNEWFATCSAQRLFFPDALPHVKKLVYVDSDVLFMSHVLELWNHVLRLDDKHLGGAAPEHELPGDGWYNLKSKIPYYGPRGLNTGILLMNIEAMRSFPFSEAVNSIAKAYSGTIKWADQDILNILFHFYPDRFYPIGCEFNYRVQHFQCDEPESGSCSCTEAEANGARILHGNRHTFHRIYRNSEAFMKIYKEFENMKITKGVHKELLRRLKTTYSELGHGEVRESLSTALFSRLETFIAEQARASESQRD